MVKDDIGFDADKMQGLCNALCYSYTRACRSVSVSFLHLCFHNAWHKS